MSSSSRSSAGSSRRRSSVMFLLGLLAISAVLAVVILVPAGIAAYFIYTSLTPQVPPPAAPVVQAPAQPFVPPGAGPGIGRPVAPPKGNIPDAQPKLPAAPPAEKDERTPAVGDARPLPDGADRADKDALPPAPPGSDKMAEGPAAFVFMERTPAPAKVHVGQVYGILMREIPRQAMLLAARDGLGLTTRDPLLGESAPPDMPARNVLRVESLIQPKQKFQIVMSHGPRRNADNRGHLLTAAAAIKSLDCATLVMTCEKHAFESIPIAMQRGGFTGKPNRYDAAEAAAPDGIEDLLGQMTFSAEYQAVQRLHARMREKAESPGTLGALVRAYANLGMLTEHQWDSASEVFKARALLYGARLLRRLPKDAPLAHWHMAYACGLTGLHGTAITYLDYQAKRAAAANAGGNEAAGAPRPAWVDLIDAYCRYDIARLKRAATTDKHDRLAGLLWFCSVENATCPQLTTKVGEAVIEANPECYRVHDGICRVGVLGVQHQATVQAPALFAKEFPQRLRTMAGLPDAIAKRLDDGAEATVPELFRALREAGNADRQRREFSWSVLAHLARETYFAQVVQRLDFMRRRWSVPTDEAATEVLPTLTDHPYEPFIRIFAIDPLREPDKCRTLLAKLPLSDVMPSQLGLLKAYEQAKVPNLYYVQHLATVHADTLPYDLQLITPRYDKQPAGLLAVARALMGISPHAPAARGLTIRADWDTARKQIDAWEKDAQHPLVLMYLGEHYLRARQFDDAVRCLDRAIAMSPEFASFIYLAEAHRHAKRMDQWQAALDRYLAMKPPGLEPARVRVMIAAELMRRKQWEKARPYADDAAATYADWAMRCACECYTGLGRYTEAEQWIRRSAERYETSYMVWFLWCKRTGKGDLAAATKLVSDRFKDVSQIASPFDLQNMGFFYTLTGRPEQAMLAFKAQHKLQPAGDVSTLMLLLADEENEQFALRDQLLQRFPKGTGENPLYWLAGFYRAALAHGEKARPDLAVADKELAAMKPTLQPVGAYFVARFLEQHGLKEDAIRYYRRCVEAAEIDSAVFPTLAIDRLRILGVTIPQAKKPDA